MANPGKTGKNPSADQPVFTRVAHALDVTPKDLASFVGARYVDVKGLVAENYTGKPSELDDIWTSILDLVNQRLSLLMVVRNELNMRLQRDRERRVLRMREVEQLPRKRLTR